MSDRTSPAKFSARGFSYAWKLLRSWRAAARKDFGTAIRLVDEADEVMPLRASDRVYRAGLLLSAQRTREAHMSFAALREEFKGSDEPDLRYLRHYCTGMLSMMTPSSGQWSYEAKQGKLIDCSPSIKRRFPMASADEIYERIHPRN